MSNERIWTERIWVRAWADTADDEAALTPEQRAERCFRLYEPRICRMLVRNFPRASPTDIEDAVQFAFVQYWRELGQHREIASPVSWLTTVAKNSLLKRLAYAARWDVGGRGSESLHTLSDTLTDHTTVDDLLMQALKDERYPAAIESLPPFERRCFMGRLENLSLREIGQREHVDFRRVAEAIDRAVAQITRYINGE